MANDIHPFLNPVYTILSKRIREQTAEFDKKVEDAQQVFRAVEQKQNDLNNKLEGFYGKMIEIFGLFIAIFSFIIAGIQIAAKADGGFWEKLGTSAAIFIPVTLCIVVLLLTIRWTSRR